MNEVVIKPSLREQFLQGWAQCRVIFFSAPCGFGKSTAATALLSNHKTCVFSAEDPEFLHEPVPKNVDAIVIDSLPALKDPEDQQTLCAWIRENPELHFVILSRGGVIRACVTASLKDMYANDFTFAFLYPFSMQYYRKFGFEAGAPEYRWSVPFTAMKPQDVGGHVEQIFPGGDFTPLLTVYNTFYADHNLSAVRETYDKGLEKANLWNDKRYVFVWYNNENQPRGLMITHKIEEGGVTYLDCTHTFQSPGGFLACDAEAFNGLLFFAKSAFSSDYEKLRFTVPSDMHLEQLIGENTRTFCSVFPNGMLRVVNVERVLENCACRGTGEITLSIEDDIITENNGTWRLHFAPGEQNKVEKTDAVPDLILNIRAFSALITGARAAADIPWMPDVRLLRQAPTVPNVFYPKKCSMMDLF